MKTQLRPMGLVLGFSGIGARNGAQSMFAGLQQHAPRWAQMNMRTFNSAASPTRFRVALPVRPSCHLQSVGFTSQPPSRQVARLAFSTSAVRGTEAGKTGGPGTAKDSVGGTAPTGGKAAYPERLVIYHAGTARTTFIACLKVTTLFVFGFFDMIMTPAYIAAGEPLLKTAGIALCGIIPAAYVAWSTSSFVAAMHLHLPPYARWSRAILERFARTAPPNTRLDVTTMSLIGKPRTSSMALSDLRPANARFGTVNFVRDTSIADAQRKWWRFRAVANFNVQEGVEGVAKAGWVWKDLKEGIVKRAAGQDKVEGGKK